MSSEHTQDRSAAPAAQQKPESESYPTAATGVAALQSLLSHGYPDPKVVVKLLKQFPQDQAAMIKTLHTVVGNDYVSRLVNSSAGTDVDASVKDFKVSAMHTSTQVRGEYDAEHNKVEDVARTTKFGGSAGAIGQDGALGAQVTGAHEKTTGDEEKKRGYGGDASAYVGTDKMAAEAGAHAVHGDSTYGATGGLEVADGNVAGTVGGKYGHEKVVGQHADGEPIKAVTEAAVKAKISKDSVGLDADLSHTSGKGTTAGFGAGGEVGKDGFSGHVGYSIMTKGGSGVKMSVSHGTKVTAQPPKFMPSGQWMVAYVRATTNGVSSGGSAGIAGGASVGVGATDEEQEFESGTKLFDAQHEAQLFYENAAEELGEPKLPPQSAMGALLIPIGESRGAGKSNKVGVDGSLSMEGASVGAGASKTKADELDMKRVDDRHVQVTVLRSHEEEKHANISGGLSDTKSDTDTGSVAVTYEFDLLTPAGQVAYEKFCDERKAPAPGTARLVGVERIKANEGKDDVKIAGLEQTWTGTTKEDHVDDDKGSHDAYTGEKANNVDAGWLGKHVFGDEDANSSAKLESRIENGKDAGYTARMDFGGDSGERNREGMAEIFENDKNAPAAAHASGDWIISADIDPAAVHELEQLPVFKDAKTEEDKRRVLSKLVAQRGAKQLGAFAALGKGGIQWDVELAGDRNFTGRGGRIELENQVKSYGEALKKSPASASAILGRIHDVLADLATRKLAIANPYLYTDLPSGVRQMELDKIERFETAFKSLESEAQVETMQTTPAPAQAPSGDHRLGELRAKINAESAEILRDEPAIHAANLAVGTVMNSHTQGVSTQAWSDARNSANGHITIAQEMISRGNDLKDDVSAAREAFIGDGSSLGAAEKLQAVTHERNLCVGTALSELRAAAEALKPVINEASTHRFAEFWKSIPGAAGSAAYEDDE